MSLRSLRRAAARAASRRPPAAWAPRPNVYDCSICSRGIITVDLAEGTTPFLIRCHATTNCPGLMLSRCYQVPADMAEKAAWEWYRPNLLGLSGGARDHVSRGGLVLRRREQGGSTA